MNPVPKPVVYCAMSVAAVVLLAMLLGFDYTYKSETTTIHIGLSRKDFEDFGYVCIAILVFGSSWLWIRPEVAQGSAAPGAAIPASAPAACAAPAQPVAPAQRRSFRAALWELARSPRDVKLGGVCGGIAGAAEIPSWFVRVAFVVVGFVYGFGLLIYVLLWCCMPLGTVVGPGADADGGPRQG